jgi:hypothetical protein
MLNGGPSTVSAPHIFGADWSPDGNRMALVRVVDGAQQIEFPAGKALYKTSGWLGSLRVSPDGNRIACVEHPVRHDDAGSVITLDQAGNRQILSSGWLSLSGLTWKDSREIWFTGTRDGSPRSLWAVTTAGILRAVGQAPGILTLRDLAPDGRALVSLESRRLQIAGRIGTDQTDRDYSLTDWSRVQQLSDDGSLILFDESGEGAGPHPVSYVRNTRGGEVVRLGAGWAQGLMPDGASALLLSEDRKQLTVTPISGGSPRKLHDDGLVYQWVRIFPNGERLLALASVPGEPLKLYVRSWSGLTTVPLTSALMVRNISISPDERTVAALLPEGKLAFYPVSGGEPAFARQDEPLAPIRWSADGKWLFVQHLDSRHSASAEVSKLNVATGEIVHWATIAPDPVGVNSITGIVIAGDERSYAYSYRRVLSELYIATGWR